MLCGVLPTTSAVVPTILTLPLAAALPSLSQFCPPACPLMDSLSILQVLHPSRREARALPSTSVLQETCPATSSTLF